MVASTPVITRLVSIPRQQGVQVPGLLNSAQWIDARVLAAGVAENYPLPTDAQTPAQKGTILRFTCNAGPIYVNINGAAAAVPAGDVTDGSASIMLRTDLGSVLMTVPSPRLANISIISPSDAIVTIEVWN